MFVHRVMSLRTLGVRIFNYPFKTSFQPSAFSVTNFMYRIPLCTQAEVNAENVGINPNEFNYSKQLVLRGKAATKHQESLINQFIEQHDVASPEEWKECIDQVLDCHYGLISEMNIDGKILETCIFPKKLDLARSFLVYLKSVKRKFNGAVVSAFIKICYSCRTDLTEQDLQRIKQFTEYLQKRYLVSDNFICDSIVKGLVIQNKVDDAIKVLSESKKTSNIGKSAYAAVAVGLLENNDVEQCKQILTEVMDMQAIGSLDEVYLKWINIFYDDKDRLVELLYFLRRTEIKPTRLVCDHLISACQNLPDGNSMVGEYGTISNSGICSVCKNNLAPVELPSQEFESLRELLLKRVLVGNDIFNNTNPRELKRFFKLVHDESPFNLIIDGLNVSYMIGTSVPTPMFVKLMETVVQHFSGLGMKCLLMGREHMSKWPGMIEMLEKSDTKYFFLQNISEDDPFSLYAAMYSGSQCMIATRDLFRSEKFRLGSEKESTLFKRWLQSHQLFITYVSPSGKVYTRSPITFEMSVQGDEKGNWHIPFAELYDVKFDEYGIHRKWLCLRKNC